MVQSEVLHSGSWDNSSAAAALVDGFAQGCIQGQRPPLAASPAGESVWTEVYRCVCVLLVQPAPSPDHRPSSPFFTFEWRFG